MFWTDGFFEVEWRGIDLATCRADDGECFIDLPDSNTEIVIQQNDVCPVEEINIILERCHDLDGDEVCYGDGNC